jgi:hypothetical protein
MGSLTMPPGTQRKPNVYEELDKSTANLKTVCNKWKPDQRKLGIME